MNFLAHAYLSGENQHILVGNFIADFVKGRSALAGYDREIVRGIELHRSIDLFTDTHPVVALSKQRLRPKYRHYAGVVVDIFYDHFLARAWSDWHNSLLPDFARQVYRVMETHHDVLPDGVRYMLPYMMRDNWLVNYGRIEGIRRALSGMARRTPFDSKIDEATLELESHYDSFAEEFNRFFPALRDHCAEWLSNPAHR